MIEFGAFRYDSESRLLYRGNEEVLLPPRVVAVLESLLARPGKIVSKEKLLGSAWEGAFVGEDSLTQAISHLRQALGDDPQRPTYIQTIPRRGYRMIAAVSEDPGRAQSTAEEIEERGSAGAPPAPGASAATGARLPASIPAAEFRDRLPGDGRESSFRTGAAGAVHTVGTQLPSSPRFRRSSLRSALPWVAGGIGAIIAGIIIGISLPSSPSPAPAVRFDINAPEGVTMRAPSVAVSPDGRHVTYVGLETTGVRRLYLHSLDSGEARQLPETEGATQPVFSPSGQAIAFVAGGALKKISVQGGTPTTVAIPPGVGVWGIDWEAEGVILLGVEGVGLMRMREPENSVELVVAPDPGTGEMGYQWPDVLPGGRAVLLDTYTAAAAEVSPIVLYDLESGSRRPLIDAGNRPRYVAGNVFFTRRNTLYRVPFDLRRMQVTGDPVPLEDGVYMSSISGAAGFDISETASLVFAAADPQATGRRLVWVDRATGEPTPIGQDRGRFRQPRLSPDGGRLAVSDEDGSIWIYDLERGGRELFTSEGVNLQPVWMPSGRELVFSSNRDGPMNIYRQAVDGRSAARRLTHADHGQYPVSVSPDERFLAFEEAHPETSYDIMLLRLDEGSIEQRVATTAVEMGPMFSPDGRWLAYSSIESGRDEVYLEPFPGPGPRRQVSTAGGTQPLWTASGELLFRGGETFWAAAIEPGDDRTPHLSVPAIMFEGRYHRAWNPSWDVAPDGTRFVLIENEQPGLTTELRVVLNWFEELEQRGLLRDGR